MVGAVGGAAGGNDEGVYVVMTAPARVRKQVRWGGRFTIRASSERVDVALENRVTSA